MEQMQGMEQNGAARPAYGEGLDEQLAEWSAELFRNPQYRDTSAEAQHQWRLESAARTRAIIKKQLREEIEQQMAKELGLPANWRGANKLKSLAEWHEKMACLAKADAAPRCEHMFQDGVQCGSPRMKTGRFCYAHERMARVRPRKLNLLAMEDANSIMLNIMEINRALVDEEITEKRAGMLLYSQQLGLQTLGKLTFQKTRPEAMVLEELFTAKDAESSGDHPTKAKAAFAGAPGDRVIARAPTPANEAFAGDPGDRVIGKPEELTAESAEDAEEEVAAADLRRSTQIGGEELATDEHRRALIREQISPAEEGGMNELSPVNDGMEGTGEEHRMIGSSGDRVIGEPEDLTAKDAKPSGDRVIPPQQTKRLPGTPVIG